MFQELKAAARAPVTIVVGAGLGVVSGIVLVFAFWLGVTIGSAMGEAPSGYQYCWASGVCGHYSTLTPLYIVLSVLACCGVVFGADVLVSRKLLPELPTQSDIFPRWYVTYWIVNLAAIGGGALLSLLLPASIMSAVQ